LLRELLSRQAIYSSRPKGHLEFHSANLNNQQNLQIFRLCFKGLSLYGLLPK